MPTILLNNVVFFCLLNTGWKKDKNWITCTADHKVNLSKYISANENSLLCIFLGSLSYITVNKVCLKNKVSKNLIIKIYLLFNKYMYRIAVIGKEEWACHWTGIKHRTPATQVRISITELPRPNSTVQIAPTTRISFKIWEFSSKKGFY